MTLLPTPRTINTKSGRAMESSRDNGRRSGGGQSSPPGLEEIAQLMAGEWPAHMPPADRLPESTRRLLPTPTAKCAEDSQTHRSGARTNELLLTGVAKAHATGALLLPTPTVADSRGSRNATAGRTAIKPTTSLGWTLSDIAHVDRWGNYAPAVARWEAVTGRPAPDPTETGTKGQPRLAPAFVEWLMGLPAGWVTDHLPRNPALKCLGNGVVWQQAAHAYAELLGCATSNEVAQGV